jgi:hypothetical protein
MKYPGHVTRVDSLGNAEALQHLAGNSEEKKECTRKT